MSLQRLIDCSTCAECGAVRAANCVIRAPDQPLGIDTVCVECCTRCTKGVTAGDPR